MPDIVSVYKAAEMYRKGRKVSLTEVYLTFLYDYYAYLHGWNLSEVDIEDKKLLEAMMGSLNRDFHRRSIQQAV
jgi:hypothetical protein